MAGQVPNVLILGHSSVKRLQRDMLSNFDARLDANFKLQGSAFVHLHGIGGRTVAKLRSFFYFFFIFLLQVIHTEKK